MPPDFLEVIEATSLSFSSPSSLPLLSVEVISSHHQQMDGNKSIITMIGGLPGGQGGWLIIGELLSLSLSKE